jgi:alpha-L-fucosidase
MLDWHHPDFAGHLDRYVDEYLFGQVRELCTNYGPIDGIWFDGEWDHPASTWRAPELVGMIRALQPGAVVNDRLGKGERGVTDLSDFYTREQLSEIEKKQGFELRKPWEACMTIGRSWGFRREDAPFLSGEELIRSLVDVASRGGNLLLNVGPTPEGEIPPHLVERLRAIGTWLRANGESIYGTAASPFDSLPDGKCTVKGDRLYIHLTSHPHRPVALPGLENPIRRAWLLETGEPVAVDDAAKTLLLPDQLPNDVVTTVAVQLDGRPEIEGSR